jgi:hypothetical protein
MSKIERWQEREENETGEAQDKMSLWISVMLRLLLE